MLTSDLGSDISNNGIGSGLADQPADLPTVNIHAVNIVGEVAEGGTVSPSNSGNPNSGSLDQPLDLPTVVGELEVGEGATKGGADSKTTLPSGSANSPINGELLTLGTNPDGSHFFTGIRNVDAALIGSKWSTTNLTYSFPTSGSNYSGSGYDSNGVSLYHVDLGSQQQAAARAAFAQLSAATGLTFTEITDTDTVHANIRISQTADQDDASAYGNFPSDTKGLAGDIWFGRNNQPYYDLAFKGTWGFSTMLHEIGHTMGL